MPYTAEEVDKAVAKLETACQKVITKKNSPGALLKAAELNFLVEMEAVETIFNTAIKESGDDSRN
jgi:hypothetical protein